ncbi:MAG: Unknown protein [uncultured Sulfurovum sp.]|uniref:Inverse autotransporter beta-domain domain-containing protein n=1 Tax=uncultured Sulfurovum sp. TaxID=269237 RepID=A0A6S6TET3_9BACT|nr:MAG: Unknown protein [uncultured Sulfurovum sp.]
MRTSTLLILSSTLLSANDFSSTLSSQGFTGLINTPNAQVIREGDAQLQFNTQFDNHLRGYNYNTPYNFEENYIAGIGFLSSSEFVGRLVEAPGFARDLAANIKIQIPYYHKFLPNIAVGAQDLGGEANYYDNTYIVADKELWFLRASLGYGKSGDNINREHGENTKLGKRMDGIFGGVEAKVTDWFSVMAEHDGEENHAAIRMAVPKSLLSSVKLEATLAQNLTEAQTHVAINLTVPLFAKNTTNIPYNEKKSNTNSSISTIENSITPTPVIEVQKNTTNNAGHLLKNIQQQLVKFGFENVQVGEYKKSIYVKFENSMFDHTDLDALGYVIGNISNSYPKNKHYIVTLLKNNLQTITVSGESKTFQNYLKNPNPLNSQKLKNNLVFSRDFNEKKVQFISIKPQNSSFFKPRIELSPGFITLVGTEVGAFDYLTTLRTNIYMPVYDGLVLSALYETPLAHSENFENNKVYGIRHAERLNNHLATVMAHQTVKYDALLNTFSAGQFQSDYYGVLNQTNITNSSGEHGLGLKTGYFEHRDKTIDDDKNIYLASYRYFYQPLNLFTELTYGQYWNQDRGTTLEFKRFFDQTAVSLYAQAVGYKYAGVRVSIPLTTRKLYNSKIVQVKGKSDFSHKLRTSLQEASGGNIQRPYGGINPQSDFELVNTYLDRDRLNANYIKGNLERMRDAYITYKNN